MRKTLVVLLLAALCLLCLAGCRSRVLQDPGKAETLLMLPQAQVNPTPTPSPPAQPTPTPSPSAAPTPMPTASPSVSPVPSPKAEQPPTPAATAVPGSGSPTPGETGPGRPVEVVRQEEGQSQQLGEEPTAAAVTVTYDDNGGDTPTVSTSVRPGEPYGVQPEAAWRGHLFGGWWTEQAAGRQVTPETLVDREEDHTLYAHWTRREAAVITFHGNGGRVKVQQEKLSLNDGDAYGPLPTPLREGYDFLGWYTQPEGGEEITPESVFTGEEDQTLYAHWEYDPYAFWTFTLQNKTQQIYLCQQTSIYFETEQDNVTQSYVDLISSTGSLNLAEYRDDPFVPEDWIQAKNPQVVLKATGNMGAADQVQAAMQARLPGAWVIVVDNSALSGGPAGLYAGLALGKALYPDWYTDVDLSVAAAELGVSPGVLLF